MGWDKSWTSQKMKKVNTWDIDEVELALDVLNLKPKDIQKYFFK